MMTTLVKGAQFSVAWRERYRSSVVVAVKSGSGVERARVGGGREVLAGLQVGGSAVAAA